MATFLVALMEGVETDLGKADSKEKRAEFLC